MTLQLNTQNVPVAKALLQFPLLSWLENNSVLYSEHSVTELKKFALGFTLDMEKEWRQCKEQNKMSAALTDFNYVIIRYANPVSGQFSTILKI